MTKLLRITAFALGIAMFTAGPAFAQLSKTDQGCINEINKGMSKLVQTLNKGVQLCIKDQSNEKVTDADECWDADAKGKILKSVLKAEGGSEKKCTDATTATLQEFFGSDVDLSLPLNGPADVANAEAFSKESRLMQAFLGSDFSSNVVPKTDKDAAKCQQGILKDLFKCQDTKIKEFLKCKKTALKEGAVTANDVEVACMGVGEGQPDEKGKIKKACGTDLGAVKLDKPANTATKKLSCQGSQSRRRLQRLRRATHCSRASVTGRPTTRSTWIAWSASSSVTSAARSTRPTACRGTATSSMTASPTTAVAPAATRTTRLSSQPFQVVWMPAPVIRFASSAASTGRL